MSSDKSPDKTKRRYRDYKWVTLVKPIRCPQRNASNDAFPGDRFAFFVEDGWFCIEVRATGAVVEVPFAQVAEARRKTAEELEIERREVEKALVVEASA